MFFFGGGQTTYCPTLRGGGRISRGATMVGAERENFEDLEPLDCRIVRFSAFF